MQEGGGRSFLPSGSTLQEKGRVIFKSTFSCFWLYNQLEAGFTRLRPLVDEFKRGKGSGSREGEGRDQDQLQEEGQQTDKEGRVTVLLTVIRLLTWQNKVMDLRLQVIHQPMSSIPTFVSDSSPCNGWLAIKPPVVPFGPADGGHCIPVQPLPDSRGARQQPCLVIYTGHCVAADRLMGKSQARPGGVNLQIHILVFMTSHTKSDKKVSFPAWPRLIREKEC
ncbi:hypothetical protein B0T21DRAFT_203738 [Apiosordaria backusii]|uniref:Uncharacterized protein n=1 Tax=Apiosordaria backusii TaxID=314023 RepID=A0AA40E9E7_9PEZI|nr:hypothetical protein B0T21DRAFT_203738 [Apiosordaria backusii]